MENRKSPWSAVLTSAELESFHALTASLDPGYARRQMEFYEAQTARQLSALRSQAWYANDGDGYQLAGSYLAKNFPDFQ